jgi:hypothetical protein
MVDLIDQPATLWRREVFEKCGPLAENLHFVFDWDYFIRCAQHTKPVACPHPIAAYRFHESNKTTGLNLARTEELIGISMKYLPRNLRAKFSLVIPLLRVLKKMTWEQIHGVWVWRKMANIVLFLFRSGWFLRLLGIPTEVRLAHGFEGVLHSELMTFKVSELPAYTTADAFACFPEVWEVPES